MTIDDFGFWLEEEEVLWRRISDFPGEQGTSVQQPPAPDEGCAPIHRLPQWCVAFVHRK
jgi:hypothetical protein